MEPQFLYRRTLMVNLRSFFPFLPKQVMVSLNLFINNLPQIPNNKANLLSKLRMHFLRLELQPLDHPPAPLGLAVPESGHLVGRLAVAGQEGHFFDIAAGFSVG